MVHVGLVPPENANVPVPANVPPVKFALPDIFSVPVPVLNVPPERAKAPESVITLAPLVNAPADWLNEPTDNACPLELNVAIVPFRVRLPVVVRL